MNLSDFTTELIKGQNLSSDQMRLIMDELLSGHCSDEEIASFLAALRDKGETIDEITGAVLALREKLPPLNPKYSDVIDVCGTGGDGKNTFNISTAVAFVVAGAGIQVAKHGNKAVSSASGSADILKELGVNIEASPACMLTCVDQLGIGFFYAPLYHGALKNVAKARQLLKTKTIFNILGPLLNPMQAKKQVIGVYDFKLLKIMTQVLAELGSTHVSVVHGRDGLDEVTMTGKTDISHLRDGKISTEVFDPVDVGYKPCTPEDLKGGTKAQNAKRLRLVLKGHSEPLDHCVHLNAALAILVSGKADNWKEALLVVQQSISSGKAYQTLEQLIEMTR